MKTNSLHGKKIINKVMEEQFNPFICYNLSRETEWQCTFDKFTIHRAVVMKKNFPMAKCTGEQQKSPQLLNKVMEEQSTWEILCSPQLLLTLLICKS